MENMHQLFQRRFNKYLAEIGKYARLIMNDHFSFILLMVLAFGALFYRDLLISLQAFNLQEYYYLIIILSGIYLSVLLQIGRPLWLTRGADASYLFAQGINWQTYWLRGTLLSAILPAVLIGLGSLLLIPILSLVTAWEFSQSWILVIILILLKIEILLIHYLSIFGLNIHLWGGRANRFLPSLIICLVLIISFMLRSPYHIIAPFILIILLAIQIIWGMKERKQRWMAFEYVVEEELQRTSNFYKWISVFADVPHLKPSVKRRKYLDPLIGLLAPLNQNRYSYLYLRMLFRNNAYSGVWLRVMLFVLVLIAITRTYWLVFALGLLGHVLTVVQLMPLLRLNQHHPFQIIYPQRTDTELPAFQNTLILVVMLQTVAYSLITLIFLGLHLEILVLIAAWFLIGFSLAYFYVPWWFGRQ